MYIKKKKEMNVNNLYCAFYAKEQFMQEKLTKSGQLMTVRFINRSQAQIIMHTNECFDFCLLL